MYFFLNCYKCYLVQNQHYYYIGAMKSSTLSHEMDSFSLGKNLFKMFV